MCHACADSSHDLSQSTDSILCAVCGLQFAVSAGFEMSMSCDPVYLSEYGDGLCGRGSVPGSVEEFSCWPCRGQEGGNYMPPLSLTPSLHGACLIKHGVNISFTVYNISCTRKLETRLQIVFQNVQIST
jgi:hypothetical protein